MPVPDSATPGGDRLRPRRWPAVSRRPGQEPLHRPHVHPAAPAAARGRRRPEVQPAARGAARPAHRPRRRQHRARHDDAAHRGHAAPRGRRRGPPAHLRAADPLRLPPGRRHRARGDADRQHAHASTEIRELVGADSLGYLSLDGLVQADRAARARSCATPASTGATRCRSTAWSTSSAWSGRARELRRRRASTWRRPRKTSDASASTCARRTGRTCWATSAPSPGCSTSPTCAIPVLVASTDGVGTKVLLGLELGRHDLLGPRPGQPLGQRRAHDRRAAAVLPRLRRACTRSTTRSWKALVAGMAAACRDNGCALLGGETAQLPDLYAPGHYRPGRHDRRRGRARAGRRRLDVRAGDRVWGCRRPGLHTNGFSLARQIVARAATWTRDPGGQLGQSLGEALLAPHPSYLAGARSRCAADVKAIAHITGGGVPGNLPRVLPEDVSVELDWGAWPVPPIFTCSRSSAASRDDEMLRVFNMGLGLVFGHRAVTCELATRARDRPRRAAPRRARRHLAAEQMLRVAVLVSGAAPTCRRCSTPAPSPTSRRASCWSAAIAPARPRSIAPAAATCPSAWSDRARDAHDAQSARRVLREALEAAQVELVVLAGFDEILGQSFVQAYRRPHRSTPIRRCCPRLAARCTRWPRRSRTASRSRGCTVHLVTDDLDTGPILLAARASRCATTTTSRRCTRAFASRSIACCREAVRAFAEDRVRIEGDVGHAW